MCRVKGWILDGYPRTMELGQELFAGTYFI